MRKKLIVFLLALVLICIGICKIHQPDRNKWENRWELQAIAHFEDSLRIRLHPHYKDCVLQESEMRGWTTQQEVIQFLNKYVTPKHWAIEGGVR